MHSLEDRPARHVPRLRPIVLDNPAIPGEGPRWDDSAATGWFARPSAGPSSSPRARPVARPPDPDPARDLDRLWSAEGRALLAELAHGPLDPAEALRLGTRLRGRHPAELVAAALAQRELRSRASAKFARAEAMWFTRQGLEQASAEPLARHRAARYAEFARVADLCAGIGGDLLALAQGRTALAVDLDEVQLRMARQNARVYGAGELVAACADVRDLRLPPSLAVFVDPARRVGGRRLPAGESRPQLAWCLDLAARVAAVGVKAAPGLRLGLVPPGWEAELLADRRELKEAALWSPALATVTRRATVFPGRHTLVAAPGPPVARARPGAFLLDPNPAVTRAGLVEELARELGAWKLDPRIAFLSADQPMRTPFGRLLRVEASLPWNLKRLRQVLHERRVGVVEVRKRGSAVEVGELTARLRLRGDHRATVVLTRVADRPWAMVCTDEPTPPGIVGA
jgi:THUMP domain-containing protein/RNA cap guanine-N2 methyltransferase